MAYTQEKLEELKHRWTTPKGKRLIKLIKSSRCYLSPVLFREKVNNFPAINDEEVKDAIDLRGIPLAGFDFRTPVLEESDFQEEIAILSDIHFEGANLKHCNFEGGKIHNCNFEHCNLSYAEFKRASLNTCNFSESECFAVDFHGTKIIDCDFKDASIKDVSFERTLIDQHSSFGDKIKSEKEKNYHYASIEYKQIKELYKGSSLHSMADLYHQKEMIAKRKSLSKANPLYWINYLFGDLLCGYGTSFAKVTMACLVTIFVCALLYTHNHSLVFHNQETVKASLSDAIYFSTVTFTTLGYGDFSPIGSMRHVAALESFIGAALLSLFTVIVARKLIRD